VKIAEASTEQGKVVLWDPAALPEDFDSRFRGEAPELLEKLQKKGVLRVHKTGEDGDCRLHLYVDEPPPADIARFLKNPGHMSRLAVPGGQLWLAGAEFVFRTEDAELKKWPAMGTRIEIPPGTYDFRWSRVKISGEALEEQRRAALGEDVYEKLQGEPGRLGICLVLTLLAVTLHFLEGPALWSWALLTLAAGAWIVFLASRRTPAYRKAKERLRELERETPSLVAELQRVGD
jgi:hypothetical protein